MKMTVAASLVALAAIAGGIAFAADDPVVARQQLMKENGQAAKLGFQMARGKVPFDATAAADAMNRIAAAMDTFPTLFPPGSDKAPKTTASPDIFANMDDFKGRTAKLQTDAKAAAAAAAQGVEAFAVAFDAVDHDCGGCHQKYRTE
jgi:cytochrome c556